MIYSSSPVQIEGFPELFAAMDRLKEEIGKGKTDKIWRDAMRAAFAPVLAAAKVNAPKDTGQLADHIYMKVHRPSVRDKESKRYIPGEIYMARVTASTLRDDSQLHFILNRRGKFQTTWRKKRPVAISQEFGNSRTPAHPFLRPALDGNLNVVTKILEAKLAAAIEMFGRQAAKG